MHYILRTDDGSSWLIDNINKTWQHLIHVDDGSVKTEQGPMLATTSIKKGHPMTIFVPKQGSIDGRIGKLVKTAIIKSVEYGDEINEAVSEVR